MEVLDADIARLPAENVRVPRTEFVAVWVAAERHQEAQAAAGCSGLVRRRGGETCRLARAIVRAANRPWRVAHSPVTHRSEQAYPEVIEAECIAAGRLDMRRPAWLEGREGWPVGILTTLNWAWRRSGRPPFRVENSAAG